MSPDFSSLAAAASAHVEGAEAPPYVVDNGKVRSLHFDREEIQSAMWVDRPDALYLEYTRLMMGFLLFQAKPTAIAMIGVGGGSLVKFCHRHLPEARIAAVEIDPVIIALRERFCIPADDARLQIIQADGAAFLAGTADASLDALLLDGYGPGGVPPALSSQAFYDECARCLQPDGVLVCNQHIAHPDFDLHVTRLRRSFPATLEVTEGERGNCIIFAGSTGFAAALRRVVMRRPASIDREAWAELKSSLGRIAAAARAQPL